VAAVACMRGERRLGPIMRDIRDGLEVVVWVAGARGDFKKGMVICTDGQSSRYNMQLVDMVGTENCSRSRVLYSTQESSQLLPGSTS